jgi:hypothetical protein
MAEKKTESNIGQIIAARAVTTSDASSVTITAANGEFLWTHFSPRDQAQKSVVRDAVTVVAELVNEGIEMAKAAPVERNDGGPAYPVEEIPGVRQGWCGMTLRMNIAIRAMEALIIGGRSMGEGFDIRVENTVQDAFAYADAMLAQEAR